MAVIPVELAGRSYEVRVAAGLLADLPQQCSPRLRKRRVPVITDANVFAAWGAAVEHALHEGGHEAAWRVLPRVAPALRLLLAFALLPVQLVRQFVALRTRK